MTTLAKASRPDKPHKACMPWRRKTTVVAIKLHHHQSFLGRRLWLYLCWPPDKTFDATYVETHVGSCQTVDPTIEEESALTTMSSTWESCPCFCTAQSTLQLEIDTLWPIIVESLPNADMTPLDTHLRVHLFTARHNTKYQKNDGFLKK
jgi:hypothetical protein